MANKSTLKSGNTENFNFSLKSLKNASIVSAVPDFLIDSSFRSNLMEKKKEKFGNQPCFVLHHWNAGWSSWCTESSLSCPPSSSPDRGTPCRSHSYFNMNMWKHGVCFKLSIYNLLLAGSVNRENMAWKSECCRGCWKTFCYTEWNAQNITVFLI